jgi:hypothetical protein
MSNLGRCPRCRGTGKTKLNSTFQAGYDTLKRCKVTIIATFAKEMKLELTAAHHMMNRMIELGIAEQVTEERPATYRAVKLKSKHRCQTPPTSP